MARKGIPDRDRELIKSMTEKGISDAEIKRTFGYSHTAVAKITSVYWEQKMAMKREETY